MNHSKSKVARVMDSPFVLLFFVLLASALGGAWYQKSYAAFAAPAIPGYDWSRHPDGLLIAVPPGDCGCSMTASDLASKGIAKRLDVLVIASGRHEQVDELKKQRLPQARLSIMTNVNRDIIKQFSPHDKIAAVRIRNGRIVQHAEGNIPETFYQ